MSIITKEAPTSVRQLPKVDESTGVGPSGPWVPPRLTEAPKILCLDGGGIRGLMDAVFLFWLEEETGKQIHELYDLVVGTSTGGILAVAIGAGIPMETVMNMYVSRAKKIFHAPWHWKIRRLRQVKAPKYPSKGLTEVLQEQLGTVGFGEMKTRVMVTTFRTNTERAMDGGLDWVTNLAGDFLSSQAEVTEYRARPFVHQRVKMPNTNGKDSVGLLKSWQKKYHGIKAWEAAYATAAAPTYFPGIVIGNRAYFDGGVYAQNPTDIGITEALKMWGTLPMVHSMSTAVPGKMPMDTSDPDDLQALVNNGKWLWVKFGPGVMDDLGVTA